MRIDIILPYKEIFSNEKASAVSLTIKNSIEFSKFKKNITIFGQFTNKPFSKINFIGIKINKYFHFGKNKKILSNYIKLNKKKIKENTIIEIHNRPYIFNLAIKKYLIKDPITLHFHNDPRDMKGSKTIEERQFIAENAAAIYFVSEYIKNCFVDDLDKNFDNLFVIPNAIQRTFTSQPIKKKEILCVGRLVYEKGVHLFVKAIRDIVKEHQDWKFKIIGTPKAGQNNFKSSYAKDLINEFNSLGKNVEYLGFIANKEVKNYLEKASILVVPSIWEEPFALTALEGFCYGTAIIASKVGGMSELLKDTALLIEDINQEKLKDSIKKLILDKDLLIKYQKKSWVNYKYNQSDIVILQDNLRKNIFKKFKF